MKVHNTLKALFILVILFSFSGCTVIFQKGRRSDIEKISELSHEIDRLSRSKTDLEERLKKEIADKDISLSLEDRGLVITFLSEVLFDSGKAVLKKEAYSSLDKVANVLLDSAAGLKVGIEGHTDNVPIKVSRWESNWDLSSARARSVLKYLLTKSVEPDRLSFTGYGEYRPVASNDTAAGRQKNRRVEIIILPEITKAMPEKETEALSEPRENLK